MVDFEQLFGVPRESIKKTCVLTPFLSNGMLQSLEVGEFHKGSPFSCGQAEDFSLIHTHVGAPFVGDAVLYLEDSPCENIIFVGACGAVKPTDTISFGSIVIPARTFNYESFSHLLNRHGDKKNPGVPDNTLVDKLLMLDDSLFTVDCASFGSLLLEESYVDVLKKEEIDVVEMETCAFFHAARHIRRKGLALLYVTDVIGESHVFAPMSAARQSAIQITQQRMFRIVREFAAELRSP